MTVDSPNAGSSTRMRQLTLSCGVPTNEGRSGEGSNALKEARALATI
ncbi:hypothetical protein L915_01855 [Phytophthora nicotianae]|uniref:Uncharacterized protein n=1 Tax=Phytophthora nicotianae TaxID=4792 RepID=W2HKT8_PHYNI|nr:hypothetical protein L915_01855 [Phytophthora nicotianae]